MNVVQINLHNPAPEILLKAVEVLKQGGIVGHPTDTCYGFAVDVLNHKALQLLYKVKQMRETKPVTIMVSSVTQVGGYAEVSQKARQLMEKYWPGALTIVIPRLLSLPSFVNSESQTVGFRMPDCAVSRGLLECFGGILTTTSANISGRKSPYSLQDMLEQFVDAHFQPDLILDAGSLPEVPASTVVEVSGQGLKIIRQGSIQI